MPAYADSYISPSSSSSAREPVYLTLALGVEDVVEHGMEWEVLPAAEEVLDAVASLREERMDVDEMGWWEGGRTKEGEGGAGEEGVKVVIDTNILLRHLTLLQSLTSLLAQASITSMQAATPTLLIPHIVVSELDGLKLSTRHASDSQASIATLARRATSWLLDAVGTTSVARGQRREETLLSHSRDRAEVTNNDGLVLDAALFHLWQGRKAVLLSEDKNLCLRARIEGVGEAFGVEEGWTVRDLLGRVDPAFAGLVKGFWGHQTETAPSTRNSTTRRRQLAPSSAPNSTRPPAVNRQRSIHSPPQRPPPLPSLSTPIPLASTRPSTHEAMDLEPPSPPPLSSTSFTPTLKPICDPSDIFYNLSQVMASFLACRLYRQVFEKLSETNEREEERREWIQELGDWRRWEARDCVRVVRRWWSEGGVEEVCRRGLGREPPTPRVEERKPPKPTSTPRGTQSSRWATSAPLTSRDCSPSPPPPPPVAPRLSSPSERLTSLYASLPHLQASLSSLAHETNTWSAPRWEVLLEGVGELLGALLGGWFEGGEGVESGVWEVVREWEMGLRGVGVQVEVGR